MSREIRKVPKNWSHPRNCDGQFVPLYDADFESVARKWWADAMVHKASGDSEYWYWEHDPPPDRESHREPWTEPADHFQIYQTVSEGTPVSPVFVSLADLVEWMCRPADCNSEWDGDCQGRTRHQAETFAKIGWAPSGGMVETVTGRRLVDGISFIGAATLPAEGQYDDAR